MITWLLAVIAFASTNGEGLLDETSVRYSAAEGIQWKIESVVYSDIFEEADTTELEFAYSEPDTFSLIGTKEKLIGIADTLWVLSERHRQIQKKPFDSGSMPASFILGWKNDYDMESYKTDGSETAFELTGKEGVVPSALTVKIDRKLRIKSIIYTDTKGDQVTLSIKGEKLKRPGEFELFYLSIPAGYDLIDLTE